jgi:hypothetical protein
LRQDTLLGSKLLSNSEAPVLNEVAKAYKKGNTETNTSTVAAA